MNYKTAFIFFFSFILVLAASFYFLLQFTAKPQPFLKITPQDAGVLLSFVLDQDAKEKLQTLSQKAQIPIDFSQSIEVGLDASASAQLKNIGEMHVSLVPQGDAVSWSLKKDFPGKTGNLFTQTKFFPEETLVYFAVPTPSEDVLKVIDQNWPVALKEFLNQLYGQTENFSLGIFNEEDKPVYALVSRANNSAEVSAKLAKFSDVAAEIKKNVSEKEGIAVGFKEGTLGKVKTYTLTLPRGFSEDFKTSDLTISAGVFDGNLVLASSEEALGSIDQVASGKKKSFDSKNVNVISSSGIAGLWVFDPAQVFSQDFLSQAPFGKIELGQRNFERNFERIKQLEVVVKPDGISGRVELK